MRKDPLIIFGNSSFAELVAYHFESEGNRKVAAFTVHEKFITDSQFNSRPLVPFETVTEEFDPSEFEIFVALEHGRQNSSRAEIAAESTALGYSLASFISPQACVARTAVIGEHALVLEQTVIQHDVRLGCNNLILASAFLGQSCRIGSNNYFGSGFFADRFSSIGNYNVFGSKVRIGESVTVRDWACIQAFEALTESFSHPTIIHPTLRTHGHVVDRRSLAS